ncbi:MAG: membrane protein insertion efficiency factor YidD, partial [Candidatus Daviesbacteria bacterium]|nr:membrane protein insertion efficiency factor YidD [Candidatus Daviesbacteria bacterium]
GGACRYNPTCSEYTKQKIGKFGVFRGTWLGLQKILSCR